MFGRWLRTFDRWWLQARGLRLPEDMPLSRLNELIELEKWRQDAVFADHAKFLRELAVYESLMESEDL